ncbi:MAG: alanine racemase [Deltaproteobacteria bacterium]|nr:alanine racemase [Deltaproteobacteria bacterium]MBW1860841.1 alanine racemase [Deltaproteobacteria bacterium]
MDEYKIVNADKIPTPALVVYRKFVEENIRSIGEMLGGFVRLRPHIKTHKMSRIARMEMEAGIDKFKCATPKEAAMLASLGVTDILISYPIVGAAIERVISLKQSYPEVDLKVIADDMGAVRALSGSCVATKVTLGIMIDLNTGMDRTGTSSREVALNLAQAIIALPCLTFEGLHAYDGHVSDPDPEVRRQTAVEAIEKAVGIRGLIEKEGIQVKRLIASGTPGFEFTAKVPEVDEVSPGTWIFWDTGYGGKISGRFQWAALVLSSVISMPGPDLITLDAGSKAISPDTPKPYFRALSLPENVEFFLRSEEHQVLRLPPGTPRPAVGDLFYLVPRHVCTTINLWDEACVIDHGGNFVETWPVDARGH